MPSLYPKPGFLLIEIMCGLVLLTIAGSIMAFYSGFVQKEHTMALNRLETAIEASNALDSLKDGFRPKSSKNCQIQVIQEPVYIQWSDGPVDQVWGSRVHVSSRGAKPMIFETFLDTKAL